MLFPNRVIAQVIELGTFEDVQSMVESLGAQRLVDVIMVAEAGWFTPRSWHYWHYRLGLAEVGQVPPLPIRSFEGALVHGEIRFPGTARRWYSPVRVELTILNITETFSDEVVEKAIRDRVLPEVAAFHYMRDKVEVSLRVDYGVIFQILVRRPTDRHPDFWYVVSDSDVKSTDTSAMACVAGEYFHAASHYSEWFTGQGETLAVALKEWWKNVDEREILLTARGNITFPSIPFHLYYHPRKGGWQPVTDNRKVRGAPKVYLGEMPPRWRKAWDRFCEVNPKFLNGKVRDEAKNPIKIAPYEGPTLEID